MDDSGQVQPEVKMCQTSQDRKGDLHFLHLCGHMGLQYIERADQIAKERAKRLVVRKVHGKDKAPGATMRQEAQSKTLRDQEVQRCATLDSWRSTVRNTKGDGDDTERKGKVYVSPNSELD